MQDSEPFEIQDTVALLRYMLLVACEPASIGTMAGAAAPADPIFHMMHGGIEKAYHILRRSPTYNQDYDFEWVDSYCGEGVSGGALDETLPVSGKKPSTWLEK